YRQPAKGNPRKQHRIDHEEQRHPEPGGGLIDGHQRVEINGHHVAVCQRENQNHKAQRHQHQPADNAFTHGIFHSCCASVNPPDDLGVQPPLSRSRISLPALNWGTYFSSTSTCSPVRGLRPTLAGRFLTEKAPKPRNSTRSPRASASPISSRMALTMFSTSRWNRCGFSAASFSMSSDLIMSGRTPPGQAANGFSGIENLPGRRVPKRDQPVKREALPSGIGQSDRDRAEQKVEPAARPAWR